MNLPEKVQVYIDEFLLLIQFLLMGVLTALFVCYTVLADGTGRFIIRLNDFVFVCSTVFFLVHF